MISAFRLHHRPLALLAVAIVVLLSVRCAGGPAPAPENCSIVACGERLDIGTRVVLWTEPSGYDAYLRAKFFTEEAAPDGRLRYATRRGGLATKPEDAIDRDLDLRALQQIVHQFVLHFDVCGTSRQCFKVLQDVRNLSVHFLLDVDGTIYQTLDLRERAQHATIANEFSVGVEIAHPGTFPQPLNADMRRWYEQDEHGWRMKFPQFLAETGVRTPGFVPRPARPEMVSGPVHGKMQWQFDYTEAQYEALAKLCAGLSRLFPRIPLRAPRDDAGNLVTTKLPDDDLRAFDGIVGHFHVQTNKTDPGPAMQWDRLLLDASTLNGDIVLEDPDRPMELPDYIKVPYSPVFVWRSMATWLRERLASGVSMRAAVEELRRLHPDYRVSVPQPRLLRIEFVGQWPIPDPDRRVEGVFMPL